MRVAVMLLMVLAVAGGFSAWADGDSKSPKPAPDTNREKPGAELTLQQEQIALDFVRENHPELLQVLEQLKPMKPAEYNRAVSEIYWVWMSLTRMKKNDPKRYEVGLEMWKARSRVELLTAKLINAPGSELESKLRDAVAHQVDVELRQQKVERDQTEARLKKLNANIERLESNPQKLIENRYQLILKQSKRTRRRDGGNAAPTPPAKAKQGESKG